VGARWPGGEGAALPLQRGRGCGEAGFEIRLLIINALRRFQGQKLAIFAIFFPNNRMS
jgi:hypothetical protein